VKEKRQITYKGKTIKIKADFSNQTLNPRTSKKDMIQAKKETNCQPRLIYPAKLSFIFEGKINPSTKQKLKEFTTTTLALQKIISGLLHIKEETRVRQEDSRKNKPF
jgi:hypothetical protein